MSLRSPCMIVAIAFAVAQPVGAEDCEFTSQILVETDHFSGVASSGQGAIGDIVAIDIAIDVHFRPAAFGDDYTLYALALVGCFDSRALELAGFEYADEYEEMSLLPNFFTDMSTDPEEGRFLVTGGIQAEYKGVFDQTPGPAFIGTVYFRVVGDGDRNVDVRICDDVMIGLSCEANYMAYSQPGAGRGAIARSTLHVPGVVRVLPGPPTHPDLPDLPPEARVYEETPTAENTDITFELVGPSVTFPGARNVPVDVFVTSSHEFSGFMTSVRFSPGLLELVRVEEHVRPGTVWIENELGACGLLLSDVRRRIGSEGERVRIATLRFDVDSTARTGDSVDLAFEPAGNFMNWLGIRHSRGLLENPLPVTAEVTPIALGAAAVRVGRATARGDANTDGEVDIGDVGAILGYLFQGRVIACREAAEFNGDGRVNIADPIAILNALFHAAGTIDDAPPVGCE